MTLNAIAELVKKSDITLFYFFNRKFHYNKLILLMRNITHLGSTTFSVAFSLIMLLYSLHRSENLGIQMIFTLLLGNIIVQTIKRLVNRPRPYTTLSDISPINPPDCKYSFPSGHTCAAFSMAFILARFIPSLSIIFIFLALLVALSRVYLGVHYPTDIAIGIIIAYISTKLVILMDIPKNFIR